LYDSAVTTDKLSATVDAELLAEVRDRAGPRGLSAFVSRALRHELDRVALRELLDELAGQLGPPDEAMVAEADALLDDLAKSARRRGRRAPAA
jgi:Arc/MetJ family transcription regulator